MPDDAQASDAQGAADVGAPGPPAGPGTPTSLGPQPDVDQEAKTPSYEIFIALISILSLLNMGIYYLLSGDDQLQVLISVMNVFLSGIFLLDFIGRLVRADRPRDYFFRRYGWADLLGSLPFHAVKVFRLFRLIRIFRLVRSHGAKKLATTLILDRAGSSLSVMLMLGILVLEFGSLAILRIEVYAPGANITSASDALWYVIETISTVGYGDEYPVTNAGRLVGSMIIVIGVGIFGTFTGYVANFFVNPGRSTRGSAGSS